MPPDAARIGEWLEAARRRHGQYSQEQAAAQVGTTSRTMGAWERGETVPPTDQFIALVQLYKADPMELFRTTDPPDATTDWTMAPAPSGKQVQPRRKDRGA